VARILCEYSKENMAAVEAGFVCKRCKPSCCQTLGKALITDAEIDLLSELSGDALFREHHTFIEGKQFLRLPCPFYKDGCTIYEFRPRICREYPFFIHRKDKSFITIQSNCAGGK